MLELRILGPLDLIADDGLPVHQVLAQPKRTAIFVYLAADRPEAFQRRDELLPVFWPERDRERARNALNQALHFLRRRLGSDVLETRGREEVRVTPGAVWCDASAFEAALQEDHRERALQLYQGDLLEGFHVDGGTGFERWIDERRVALRRRARDAALDLAAEAEEAGLRPEATARLRRALSIAPWSESAARRLIRLLLEAGQRVAALREYRRLARRLERDLDVEPSEKTRRVLLDAGLDPGSHRGGPDVFSTPAPVRRLASRLTDRAVQLIDASRAENTAARELLEQAAELDPTYAPAHAALARAVAQWVNYFGGSWSRLPSALRAARHALAVDPELPEAHHARAFCLEAAGRPSEAARAYRSALRLQPGNTDTASHLGRSLVYAGEFVEALSWVQTALREAGRRPALLCEMAMVNHCLGRTDEGDELYQSALDAQPGLRWAEGSCVYFDVVHGRFDRARERAHAMLASEPAGFIGRFVAAEVALAVDDLDGAIEHGEYCYRLDPSSRSGATFQSTRTCLGFAHVRAGDRERGEALLREAEAEARGALRAGASHGGLPYDLASIYAARGEADRALDWLERAVGAGWLQHELLGVDPLFRSLRGDERLERTRRAMERQVEEQRLGRSGS